jgi:IS5 family transposase
MVGLLILKHLRNVSDEGVVERCRENVYYPNLCGMEQFNSGSPCASFELVHFSKRIGATGV